ncbi:ABC transporter ATP-binding protein [Pseudodesulfovibrio sp.]|uniref:ABC transporter ATP-binding protein n=1 Tax=Pseudodesulfovibrio sp. TaxID=2035812 RepID=UPI00262A77AD|nr:ABC transporter ATP-binding protein [Pseudodesulfovibrio sp.]MDD3312781.1 ABC transporter ATP-binding protein [Pseudodesulfovibrio sp.]
MKNLTTWQTCLFFFNEFPHQIAKTLACLLLAGFVESVGAVSIVPLLASLMGGESSSPLLGQIYGLFRGVGISPSLGNVLVVMCCAMVARAAIMMVAFREVGFIEPEIATRLRLKMLDGLLRADWGYFVSQPTGKLIHALSTECFQAGRALTLMVQASAFLIQAMVYLCVGAFISWRVLLAGLVCGSALLLCFHSLIRLIRREGMKQANALNNMSALFTDSLTGAKPLKTMGVESLFIDHIKDHVESFKQASRRSVLGISVLNSIQEPFITVLLAGGLYAGSAVLNLDGALILAMAFFFQRILTRISSFQQALQNFGTMEGSLAMLIGKIADIDGNRAAAGGSRDVVFRDRIRFRNVGVSYGAKRVLSDFNLEVPLHAVTALCGPSGSGKTTAVDLMTGLLRPGEGQVLVDGLDLAEADPAKWRGQIGYVPQEVFLFNDTVRVNITLGRDAGDEEVWKALTEAGAASFVRELEGGLDFVVGEHGRSLSGGQKQRLMIARALIGDPRLLILDESTTGLDEETERGIWASVAEMKRGRAILAISHQEAVRNVADRVVEMGNSHMQQREA